MKKSFQTLYKSRLMDILLCLLAMAVSPGSHAIDMTLAQWQELQGKPLASNLMAMEKSGLKLDSAEGILSASKLIESFALKSKLTAKQIHQLNRWKRSDAEIKVASEQDPKVLQVHIQIGPQAKDALRIIRNASLANELYEKWQEDKFTQDDLLSLKGTNKKEAFSAFFNRLPPFLQTGFADWTMEQINASELHKSGGLNHLLVHMAIIIGDADIAGFVIEKLPVNEASFDLIKAIPEHFEIAEQMTLLKAAAEKNKTRTLSFNLLAQNFAEDSSVAVLVARALEERETYWQALTVMPAFVKVGNVQAFENVVSQLPESQKAQVNMRLKKTN